MNGCLTKKDRMDSKGLSSLKLCPFTNSDSSHGFSSLIIISLFNLKKKGNESPSIIPFQHKSKNGYFLALLKAHQSNSITQYMVLTE